MNNQKIIYYEDELNEEFSTNKYLSVGDNNAFLLIWFSIIKEPTLLKLLFFILISEQ